MLHKLLLDVESANQVFIHPLSLLDRVTDLAAKVVWFTTVSDRKSTARLLYLKAEKSSFLGTPDFHSTDISAAKEQSPGSPTRLPELVWSSYPCQKTQSLRFFIFRWGRLSFIHNPHSQKVFCGTRKDCVQVDLGKTWTHTLPPTWRIIQNL